MEVVCLGWVGCSSWVVMGNDGIVLYEVDRALKAVPRMDQNDDVGNSDLKLGRAGSGNAERQVQDPRRGS